MKKLIYFIIAALLSLSFCSCSSASDSASDNYSNVKVISAKYQNLWPLVNAKPDNSTSKTPLFKFRKGKYYGVINEAGKVIADAVYEDILNYQDGFVSVKKNKKYGLINYKGKVIAKTGYDSLSSFSCGLACVKRMNKSGFINTSGKEVISVKYDKAFDFIDGIAPVCIKDKWGLINKKGTWILEPKYAQIGYTTGDENEIQVSFADGIAPVKDISGKWGYIDKAGREIIPPMFDAAYSSKNGFAAFVKDHKMGLATIKGVVLKPSYDNIGEFDKSDIAWFSLNNMTGLLNSAMKVVLEAAPYNVINAISPDGYYTICKDNKWGAVNKTGRFIINPQYDRMGSFYNGLAYILIKGKIGYINSKNNRVIPAEFNTTSGLDSDFTFGNAIVVQNGKYGIINTKGRYIVKPGYDLITKDFSNKLYIIRLGSKYGVLDSKGRIILKPVYSDIRISNSIICAYKNSSARLYDTDGNAITKKSYNILTVNNAVLSDSCTVFTFIEHGKYGAVIVRKK